MLEKEALCLHLVCEKRRKLKHIDKRRYNSFHVYSVGLLFPHLSI